MAAGGEELKNENNVIKLVWRPRNRTTWTLLLNSAMFSGSSIECLIICIHCREHKIRTVVKFSFRTSSACQLRLVVRPCSSTLDRANSVSGLQLMSVNVFPPYFSIVLTPPRPANSRITLNKTGFYKLYSCSIVSYTVMFLFFGNENNFRSGLL